MGVIPLCQVSLDTLQVVALPQCDLQLLWRLSLQNVDVLRAQVLVICVRVCVGLSGKHF